MLMKFSACLNMRSRLMLSLAAAVLFAAPSALHAQYGSTTPVHDASILKPPAGARVALVEFADMECPDCARANPLLKDAAAKYHIPWVRYDFPLAMHNWSTQSAINARWFDTKGKAIGDAYRDYIFANQPSIIGLDGLRHYTETFAKSKGISLPFAIDPQGKLAAEVKADYALGQRIGIEHTPTIWVVTANSKGAPFVEVLDRSKLFQMLDQALADTAAGSKSTAPKAAHKTASK